MSLRVAVVILNWNGAALLKQFLPSVLQTKYEALQVIVADNASTDDSVAIVKNEFPNVKLIQLPENYGFAKGYNEALKSVDADIFVLLNSDVEVTSNWIQPIVDLFENNEQIGICQPKIVNFANKQQFDYAGAAGGYIDKLGYPIAKGRIYDTIENDNQQYTGSYPIFWASGAALFIRSHLFNKLNGFDAYFFAHQEEIDLCWRTQLLGYKIYNCNEATVYHVGGATLEMGSSRKTYLNFRNNMIMLYKNLHNEDFLFVMIMRVGLNLLAAMQFLLKGEWRHSVAVVKAMWHTFTWRLQYQRKIKYAKRTLKSLDGVINKNSVWHYYIKKKKTYSDLIK